MFYLERKHILVFIFIIANISQSGKCKVNLKTLIVPLHIGVGERCWTFDFHSSYRKVCARLNVEDELLVYLMLESLSFHIKHFLDLNIGINLHPCESH